MNSDILHNCNIINMSVNRGQSPNIISRSSERVTSEASRYLSVHGILDKIYHPEGDPKGLLNEPMSRKKSSTTNFLESVTPTEKTAKIKKNKKKKKRGPMTSELKKEKTFRHQLCECCSGKAHLDITPTNDGYDSDSDALEEVDDDLSGLVESLVQENLEKYYDEIDKNLKAWLKGMEKYPVGTFLKLMKKLSETFDFFESDLYDEMQLEEGDTRVLDSYWEEITEEFKTYVITRFPLLKDFIENFALNQLDELQTRDLRQLSTYSSLIRIILDHMFDIENKKIKRKNKRKKKKQQKKQLQQEKTMEKSIQADEQLDEYETLIERLAKMTIDHQSRTTCYYDSKWLAGLSCRLKDRFELLADT